MFPGVSAIVRGCAGNTGLMKEYYRRGHTRMHTTDNRAHWQGVCTAQGHRMKKFVVKSTLKEMRRHVSTMGAPRVYCEHCDADTSVRWERAKELV